MWPVLLSLYFPLFFSSFYFVSASIPYIPQSCEKVGVFFLSNHLQTERLIQTLVTIPKSTKAMIVAAFACLWFNSAFWFLMFWTVSSSSFPFVVVWTNVLLSAVLLDQKVVHVSQNVCSMLGRGSAWWIGHAQVVRSSPTCQWSCFVTLTNTAHTFLVKLRALTLLGADCDGTCSAALWDQIFSFLST